jgi:hypothetical protein
MGTYLLTPGVMTLLLALVAGGSLAIAQGRLTRATDALTALGRPLDDAERRVVLDAATKARDVLDWVVALAEADPRAAGLWRLPAIRRAGPGPIEPTVTPSSTPATTSNRPASSSPSWPTTAATPSATAATCCWA